jgi:hypothetical protein
MKFGVFTTMVVLILFLTTVVFWGCSNSNPSGTGDTAFLNGGGMDNQNDQAYDDEIDDGYRPPEYPDIDGGKGANPELGAHLQIDGAKGVIEISSSSMIESSGGTVDASIDGKHFCLMVMPQNFIEDTEVSMEISKGFNEFNEELFILNFTPFGGDFKYYPIFEFQDEPDIGYNPGIKYTLYYWAAGTWIKYNTWDGGSDGVVRFYIPHFATYAVLKEGGSGYKPPESFDL